MNKTAGKKALALVLAAGMLCPLTAYAYEEEELVQEIINSGYYAVIDEEDYYDAFEQFDAQTAQAVAEQGSAALEKELFAKSAVLVSLDTGETLFAMNENEPMPPASITKVMTLLLVMEALDEGKISYDDTVVASAHACSMGGSQIWLKENEQMTVEELLKAAAVASANDASVALAEHVAGSEESFVALMNQRAQELGMENTHFVNATGLDAEGHVSTARDISIMSAELLKHEGIRKYTSTWMDSLRDGATSLVNTNKLVRFYKGATGLKTGTTDGAGSCLSATATRDGVSFVAVVMGCDTSDHRFASARTLLDYGFANYTVYSFSGEELAIPPVPVTLGEETEVQGQAVAVDPLLLKKGQEKLVTTEIQMVESLEAPVLPGQQIGTLVLRVEEEELGRYPITAQAEVKARGLGFCLRKLLGAFRD